MQIQFHGDPHTDGSAAMSEHVASTLRHALGRFGDRVTRVDVRLSDADGQDRHQPGAIHCMLDARLSGLPSVVVDDHADDAHHAIVSGVRKLKRAVGAALSKHDPRHPQARSVEALDLAAADTAPVPAS